MSDAPTIQRACMDCESEHGISGAGKTHGLCFRHYVARLVASPIGMSREMATIKARFKDPALFAPDLGPVAQPELVAQ